ncbi:uncharacterized protein LTR77_001468 [Saxophila tyrrhenica]|uniref:RRM domain-containing protein n=1 Tax=Saxophila tyrrhenica TaxID=1690608 RepID=A0AAV9PKJ1_9PEZI|nr:hypothetical protein LTR77_001468 [Saxophila tyrrhenica]
MFLLRRAAVRAVSQGASRQLSTLWPLNAARIARLETSKPILSRSFHQSRVWRAEEDKKEVEEAKDESTAAAQEAEEAAKAAQQAADDAVVEAAASKAPAAEPAVQEAQEVAEGESSIAEEAAEKAAAAASTAQSTGPPEPPQPAAAAPPSFPNDFQDNAQGGSSFGTPAPSRILYIGNLFFEVTAAQLEAEFGKFGTITNSRIVTDARGLSKGFGYIEYAQQSAADQAVRELDQKVYQGRRMAVQYHVRRERRPGPSGVARPKNPPSKTLFIGNMSYQMSDRDLNDLFREIRDVLDVRVAIDRRSGQPRGFAHADFIDVASAERAKQHLEKKVVYGRQLRVDFSASSAMSQTPRD